MKKNLLLAAVAFIMSTASYAQWVKPVLSTPEVTGQALVKDGETEQYLYNVEAKGFFLGANDWNTRASVSDTLGYKVKINVEDADAGFCSIIDFVETKNAWMRTFTDNRASIWVDNDNGANATTWVIEPAEGNFFKIYNNQFGNEPIEITEDNLYPDYGYLGAALSGTDTRLYLQSYFVDNSIEAGYTWVSLSQEEYDSYVATVKENYKDYKAKVDQFNAAVALGAYLDKVAAEGNGADLTEEKAVYADLTSTTEALQVALESATEKCVAWLAAQATVDNPNDVSDMIANSTFDVVGDFKGWSGTAFGAGGTKSTCAEHYNKNYDTWQDVNGGKSIANGVYRVEVAAFYRAGSIVNDWNTKDNPAFRHAKLYAKSGTDSLYNSLPTLSSWANESSELGGSPTAEGTMYVPNTMADFTAWKEKGWGSRTNVLIPVLDGKLRIGVVKSNLIDTDWTIVDDFTLTYYGNDLSAYQMWRDGVIDVVLEDMNHYDWENLLYQRSARTEFEEVIAAARTATTPEAIHDNTVAITGIVEKVLASISAYQALSDKIEEIGEGISSYSGDLIDALSDKIADMPETLLAGELTTEEVNELIASLQAEYENAIKNSLYPGMDCSKMLVNPSFKDGFTGWTKEAGNVGGLAICPNVEVYDNVVNVSQEVKDVPAGLYSISVQAFERPAVNGSYTGDEEPKVFLYMNSIQTPVMNITKDAMPEETAVDKENCYITETTGKWPYDYMVSGVGYVPNSMDGASYAFHAGRYTQKCYGLVGNDGVMKIGLTSNGAKVHWVLWANFKLVYEGKDAAGIAPILRSSIASLQEYMDGNEANMSNEVANKCNELIGEAEELAATAEDYDAMFDMLNSLSEVQAEAKASVALIEKLYEDWNAINDQMGGITSSDEDFISYVDEIGVLLDPVDIENDAKAQEYLDGLKSGWTTYVLFDGLNDESINEDNPYEATSLIRNADVEEGATVAWIFTKNGGNGPALDNGLDGTRSIEFWNGSASNLQFDIYQTINALPQGYYRLAADASNSLNGQASNAAEGRANLYAGIELTDSVALIGLTPVDVQEPACTDGYYNYVVDFYVPKTSNVRVGFKTIGTMNARWFVCDNFTFSYIGKDAPTAIEAVEDAQKSLASSAIFDLAGRKVSKAVKGVYIINGKKVIK